MVLEYVTESFRALPTYQAKASRKHVLLILLGLSRSLSITKNDPRFKPMTDTKKIKMSKFRGCIDLHLGLVKQIVGASLTDDSVTTNFTSPHPPSYFASLYQTANLTGSHVIKLGPGNDKAAKSALEAWPHSLQLGGGITRENARMWVDEYAAGAVIVTSCLFEGETYDHDSLRALSESLDKKSQLVVDFSCKRVGEGWKVCTNKWQTITDLELSQESFDMIGDYCGEVLVHAAHVEGLRIISLI
jgi:phosphoribosylformimino-5-aminoimidazole carboxamide ribotide isomerase